jgi:FkbM family methyltransferase
MTISINLGHDTEAILKEWLPLPNHVTFDVGAGPGYWSFASALRGALAYAFDFNLDSSELVTRGACKYLLSNLVMCPFGLYSHTGSVSLKTPSEIDDESTQGDVPVITMDDFADKAKLHRLDFVNIDAEWSEIQVIKGGRETIQKFLPKLIIEVHSGIDQNEVMRAVTEASISYKFRFSCGFLVAEVSP